MKPEILTPRQMSEADAATIAAGTKGFDLMRAAAGVVVDAIVENFDPCKVLVLCGPGNNGGDGFVVAQMLVDEGWSVDLVLIGKTEALRGDAALASKQWDGDLQQFSKESLETYELVVDALLGAGLDRDVTGEFATIIDAVNAARCAVVSVDMPSGLDGATGEERGVCITADMTVTFARLKPGHVLLPGRNLCGEVILGDIGIPDDVIANASSNLHLNDPVLWSLPRQEKFLHKFDRGHCLVFSGSHLQTGASRLAARAALRVGAGLVTLIGTEKALMVHAAQVTAIMLLPVETPQDLTKLLEDKRINSLVIGPAAGLFETTKHMVSSALASGANCVIDADGLSVFKSDPRVLFDAIKALPNRHVVLTPHGSEFERLFPDLVMEDKISRSRNAATRSGATVLLKGADTVIASPDGFAVINDNAPHTLATAGSGDVLSGIIGGLLAQGMGSFEAASAGAYIHGQAAIEFGGAGLIADDLPDCLPQALDAIFSMQDGS